MKVFLICFVILFFLALLAVEVWLLVSSLKMKKKDYAPNSHVFGAVIVEPRKHRAIRFVISNIIENLKPFLKPKSILFFHGSKNFEYVKDQLKSYEKYICFVPCGKENLTIDEYNKFLCSFDFWNKIPFEKVLIFQTDSMILKNRDFDLIAFLKYDYIGAPWKQWNEKVGNGGFSLRTKAACIEAIKNKNPDQNISVNEDVFFSNYIGDSKTKWKIAPNDVAKTFAVETTFYSKPFGIHKCWIHLKKHDWNALVAQNKDLEILRSLQTTVD